jgi:anti-sigma B factor antagonist
VDSRSVVVEVAGDIGMRSCGELQRALLDLLASKPTSMVLDLAAVPYMDSSGVATLVKLLSEARKAGTSLRLASLHARVRSVFEVTRLDTVFAIHSSQREALN